jgi:hypothetical protein
MTKFFLNMDINSQYYMDVFAKKEDQTDPTSIYRYTDLYLGGWNYPFKDEDMKEISESQATRFVDAVNAVGEASAESAEAFDSAEAKLEALKSELLAN